MGGTDMIARIVDFAVARRWFVLLLTGLAALIGAWALARLPIDAVPDITNNQVQVTSPHRRSPPSWSRSKSPSRSKPPSRAFLALNIPAH